MTINVTIGIPVYNEEKNIGNLLKHILEEKFIFRLDKVIVIASGCKDKSVNIINDFTKKNKKIHLVLEKKREGKSSAVNLILEKSKSDIILFIDATNIPKIGSINHIIKVFGDKEVGAASGKPIPIRNKNKTFDYVSKLIWKMHHNYCLIEPKISGELFAIRKNIVSEIPKKIINDDVYFNAILKRKRWKIVYVPDAIVFMDYKNDLITHIKRRRRIARGYIQLIEYNLNMSIPLKTKFKLTIKEMFNDPKNILKIMFAVILEVIINMLAYYDTLRGCNPYCWEK